MKSSHNLFRYARDGVWVCNVLLWVFILNQSNLLADNVTYFSDGSSASCFPVQVSKGWSLGRSESYDMISDAVLAFRKPQVTFSTSLTPVASLLSYK